MSEKRKILILTASYGSGHITAARNLQKTIAEIFPDKYQTTVLDFLALENQPAPDQKTFFQKFYNQCMERPRLWDICFSLTNNQLHSRLLSRIIRLGYFALVSQIFDRENPAIFVSTHPYWNFLVPEYNQCRRQNKLLARPYLCLITDSLTIHTTWQTKKADYLLTIDYDTREYLRQKGFSSVIATGFPVHPEFFQPLDKNFLTSLGLSPDKLTILITIGLGNYRRFLQIINWLNQSGPNNFQMIIITGKYQEIYSQLNSKKFHIPTKVIGWTDRMVDFIRAADLVIAKGGGAIISESLAAQKPVLVPVFVPGQERGNIQFLQKHNCGYYTPTLSGAKKQLYQILQQPEQLSAISRNIKNVFIRDGAKNIVQLIDDILEKRNNHL